MNILLVEDNSSDAYLLKALLTEKQNAPEVHWVTDGHQALSYITQNSKMAGTQQPDLILLDLGLPRISGYDVIKDLKHKPSFASIPIVVLTTSRNPMDKEQCLALGADAFLSKPHNLREYEVLIDELMTHHFSKLKDNSASA